jgi:hypothetical protein
MTKNTPQHPRLLVKGPLRPIPPAADPVSYTVQGHTKDEVRILRKQMDLVPGTLSMLLPASAADAECRFSFRISGPNRAVF